MQCSLCNTEMYKSDYSEKEEDKQVFVNMKFCCPNPQCTNYGYRDRKGVEAIKSSEK